MTNDKPDQLSRSEIEAAIMQLKMNAADWRRAEKMARLLATGLVGMTGDDLLQETLVKLFMGERRFPRDLHILVLLKIVMRSEASNARKHINNGPIAENVEVVTDSDEMSDKPPEDIAEAVDSRTPEDAIVAKSQIDFIFRQLEGDEEATLVLMAWIEGLEGKEAAEAVQLDMKTYDAVRKRLDRKLSSLK
jgi:DNA-directed RNA polymerase specialized sigma24 family protein